MENLLRKSKKTVAHGILQSIGWTPLVQLERYLDTSKVELLVKLESANPGGSAKDRPAALMLEQAIQDGDVTHRSTIIESSSGNMGIGLAQACRYHGLRFVCVVDPRTQAQNLSIIKALGGEIELVSKPLRGDFLSARIARVCELLERIPDSYWPNQYSNPNNPRAHHDGTISEIDQALDGDFDVLFVATSSTGTAQGCRDYLENRDRNVEVVAVDAMGSVLFGGSAGPRRIPGLGAGKLPRLAIDQTFDRVERVTDLDCVVGCRRAATREALLVGGSAGGVLESVRRMQRELSGKRCVAIAHDSGTRYLGTIFNDQWVESELGCPPHQLTELVESSGYVSTEQLCR